MKVLLRKGKFQLALEQATWLDELQPRNPAWALGMASALMALGRTDEAIALYEKNLERSGNRAGVKVMLGHAHKAVGDLDTAIRSYRDACVDKPGFGEAYWSLANTKTYAFQRCRIGRNAGAGKQRQGRPR